MTARTLLADSLALFLFISAYWHIRRPVQTEQWMSNPSVIRMVGGFLVLIGIPCLFWRGWFFGTLAILLIISGVWRLGFPQHSIRFQRRAYPRWVHGCLLLAGAIAILLLKP